MPPQALSGRAALSCVEQLSIRLNLEDSFDLHDEFRRQSQENPQPQEDGGSSLDGTVTTSE